MARLSTGWSTSPTINIGDDTHGNQPSFRTSAAQANVQQRIQVHQHRNGSSQRRAPRTAIRDHRTRTLVERKQENEKSR